MKCLRWSRELRLSFGLHWAPGSGHIGLRVPNQNVKKIHSFLLYFMVFVSSGPGAPGGARSSRRIRRAIGCCSSDVPSHLTHFARILSRSLKHFSIRSFDLSSLSALAFASQYFCSHTLSISVCLSIRSFHLGTLSVLTFSFH